MKDHYRILGVAPTASTQEIKKAYRKLAHQYHPDKDPDNPFAAARFIEIQDAYRILADILLRERYDDELRYNGNGGAKQTPTVSAEWLIKVAKDLNTSLARLDIHRISHRSLQEYILMILADAHLAVLVKARDTEMDMALVEAILQATEILHFEYLDSIAVQLNKLADTDAALQPVIDDYLSYRQRQVRRARLFPYIVLIVTLALCVLMYFYGQL